jgi:hypothetical protein
LLAAAGCAEIQEPLRSDLVSSTSEVQACAKWFAVLDDAVDRADVRDGEAYAIPGFPHLRVNRFLASFRTQVADDPAAFAAWEAHLRALGTRTRAYELQNLSPEMLATLGADGWSAAASHVEHCAAVLSELDLADRARRTSLAERAQVPDDYADWKRIVGLYPLVRIPFFEFAKGWEAESANMFQALQAGTPAPDGIVRYQPPGIAASAPEIAALLSNAKRDALGIPELSTHDAERLFATFAPVFDVETTGDYDRIGSLRWGAHEAPEVDVAQPVVYRRLAFTRYGGATLVQIAYLIWFPQRPDDSWLDPLSGRLDGLFFRVTLDQTGRPLVYDSIHPCGCYHMFFPTPLVTPIAAPDPSIEWAFVPRTLPAVVAPQRLVLRVTSRSHALTDIQPEAGAAAAGLAYTLRDDSELRILPTSSGTRSAYGPSGIVPGTERGERFAVWPLGIEDAGAMREWGRHATALVGRRQFDDADLIERRFSLRAAEHPDATRVSDR